MNRQNWMCRTAGRTPQFRGGASRARSRAVASRPSMFCKADHRCSGTRQRHENAVISMTGTQKPAGAGGKLSFLTEMVLIENAVGKGSALSGYFVEAARASICAWIGR